MLARQPALDAAWRIGGLTGRWRLAELTAPDRPVQIVDGGALAAGIPVKMRLCQTRVYKLTPTE